MASRNREFRAVREQNLSEKGSQIDQFSCRSTTFKDKSSLRQSQSSAFLKKERTPVCLDCTNHRMAKEKKQKQRLDRQKEQQKVQESGIINHRQITKLQAARDQKVKDMTSFNKQAAQRHLNSVKSQKKIDQFYLSEAERRDAEVVQLQKEVAELKKQREVRYRQELQQQLREAETKKREAREEKLKSKPEDSLIVKETESNQMKKYGQELKKQITQDRVRKEQEKKLQSKVNCQEMEHFQQDFMKYSEYRAPATKNKEINPEIFEEMRQKEKQMKLDRQAERKLKDQERKQELKRAKAQFEKNTQQQLQKMRKYATELTSQITKRKRQEERQKKTDTRESRSHLFAQEVRAISKKECGQCHHVVEQAYLSYE